jgi:8-oxo-dGTP pyrophosphatase MutT (NUDIX family)
MRGVETVSSRQVYAVSRMTVHEDELRRPDGSTGTCTVVESPDIPLVIPVDGDRMHLVEQYRHPVGGRRWEFPSGTADPVLDPDVAALAGRELREETGLTASTLTLLGTLDVMPSTLRQRCSVFVATGLSEGPPQRDLGEQDMRSSWFTRAEVERMLRDGTISDAKSAAAYALLLLHGLPASNVGGS